MSKKCFLFVNISARSVFIRKLLIMERKFQINRILTGTYVIWFVI